jgi:hypothetical protein
VKATAGSYFNAETNKQFSFILYESMRTLSV